MNMMKGYAMLKNVFYSLSVFLVLSSFAWSAETIINSYDFANQAAVDAAFIITGNDITNNAAELILSPETTIKTQGTSSLRAEYHSSGIRWFEAAFREVLSSPMDLGDLRKFKIDIYCTETTFSDLFVPYVMFYSDSNNVYRKVFAPADYRLNQGWNTITIDVGDMTIYPWGGISKENGCNLAKITTVDFVVQNLNLGTNTSASSSSKVTTVYYVDNFRGYNKSDRTQSVILNDMEYADYAAMTTAGWYASGTTASRTVTYSPVTGSYDGSKTLKMDYSVDFRWYNVGLNSPIFSPIQDLSSAKYIKMWLMGNTSNQTTSVPLLQWVFRDTTGQRAASHINVISIINGNWQSLTWPIPGETANGAPTLFQDAWDSGVGADTTLKLNCVNGMMLWSQTGVENGTNAYTIYVDDLEYGYTDATLFLKTNVGQIFTNPNGSDITLISEGVGPFTWSISTGIGTLNTTSGSTVLFTPGANVATGTITVYDDTGEFIEIPVTITPTAAPIIREDWAILE